MGEGGDCRSRVGFLRSRKGIPRPRDCLVRPSSRDVESRAGSQ